MRLHLCTVYVCTAQDVVQCVSQATSSVSSCVCFVAGALRGIHAEALLHPDHKGWISAVAAPATWTTLLSARAERVPDCSSYLSHSWECNRQWVVKPPARLPVDCPAVSPCQPPHGASPRLIKGLEAFSQSSAGAERFENASSKFRWNPSPLLPLK